MSLFSLVGEQSLPPLHSSQTKRKPFCPENKQTNKQTKTPSKSDSEQLINTIHAYLLAVISVSNLSRQLTDTTLLSLPCPTCLAISLGTETHTKSDNNEINKLDFNKLKPLHLTCNA